MGSRYKDEKPFAFYDPERDREGPRPASHNSRSPRAQQPPTHSTVPMSTSPRDQPFGHYDPDLDHRDGDRLASSHASPRDMSHGHGSEPASYGPGGRGSYQDFAGGSSGRGRGGGGGGRGGGGGGYGDGGGEPGYARRRMGDGGRGASSMGDRRYVYGGLLQQQPERGGGFDGGAAPPPAPIGSEYSHEVYASVFSDPVYGGAGQVNARAGYSEEPRGSQHKEDVLRHPDQF